MTKLMEKAIEKLRALPDEQQDQVAGLVLHELAEDQRWEASTAQHADKLAEFVKQVLEPRQ